MVSGHDRGLLMKSLKGIQVYFPPLPKSGDSDREGRTAATSVVRCLSTGNLSLHNGKYETGEDIQRKKRELLKHDWTVPKPA